jgi:hypothetical protein
VRRHLRIIAHRGASGYLRDHCEPAIDQGTSALTRQAMGQSEGLLEIAAHAAVPANGGQLRSLPHGRPRASRHSDFAAVLVAGRPHAALTGSD